MSKSEETPAVRLGESLAVFHHGVDAIDRAGEEPTPGRFLAGAVWKSRIQHESKFLYNESPFGKGSLPQICIHISLFYVDVMELGEVRLSIVEAVGR